MKINVSYNLRRTLAIAGLLIISGIFFQANAQTQPKPFARLVSSDSTNRYFEADLSQLTSFFERAYLLEIIFKDSLVVVQNSNLKNDFLPLLCNNKLETKKVLLHIEDLKAEVKRVSGRMSKSEKDILIKKYEKFR
jgi:hypothetical protein